MPGIGEFPALIGPPIPIVQAHLPFEHAADELGHRGVFFGGLPACPVRHGLFDRNRDILQGHRVRVKRIP